MDPPQRDALHTPSVQSAVASRTLARRHEMIFLLAQQQRYFFNLDAIRQPVAGHQHADTQPRGKNPGDVWTALPQQRDGTSEELPVDIAARCIAAGCPEDGTVLDPFSRTGTTGLAAQQLGRSYIGIDLITASHAIGLRRLDRAVHDMRRAA
jgi:DNA modification methylase